MIPKRIIQKVKHIEIRTKGLVNDLFGGEYHSAFKGQGMTFSEVREYYPGDDIRMIAWNVTARNNTPFVKIYEEERELTVYIMVDVSHSGGFGTFNQLKSDLAAEIAAVLGFSAIKNQDKVVFLISDFIDNGFWSSLKLANKKHDLIGIRIYDPAEISLPDLGLIKVFDPENENEFWVDTSSKKEKKLSKKSISENWEKFNDNCKKNKFDVINISTNEDYAEPIMNFFNRRERRS